jgi:ribosomal protein S18 acetylase RimI-like enzyme
MDTMPRLADIADAAAVGRLLHHFNAEYDEFSPGPEALERRMRKLLETGEITVLLAGDPPEGFAVLRFRAALVTEGLESYLQELYVVPDRRGLGIGRGLMEAAMETARERGATYMDLGTSETDVAARALYESLGFDNREGKPDGPVNYFYERAL